MPISIITAFQGIAFDDLEIDTMHLAPGRKLSALFIHPELDRDAPCNILDVAQSIFLDVVYIHFLKALTSHAEYRVGYGASFGS